MIQCRRNLTQFCHLNPKLSTGYSLILWLNNQYYYQIDSKYIINTIDIANILSP